MLEYVPTNLYIPLCDVPQVCPHQIILHHYTDYYREMEPDRKPSFYYHFVANIWQARMAMCHKWAWEYRVVGMVVWDCEEKRTPQLTIGANSK